MGRLIWRNENIVIREYKTKDKDFLSRISRLPNNCDFHSLQAYSFCDDYSIRRSMTQNGFIWVAEDDITNKVIGGLCLAEKRLKINGVERLFFYPFDAIVDPEYRSLSILKRLTDLATLTFMEHYDLKPITYTSTSITNENMDRFYKNTSMKEMVQQVQHAWRVEHPFIEPQRDERVKIWKERDCHLVKEKFDIHFKNYEMVPVEFDELLFNKFYKHSYFAQFKGENNKMIEASISIWDQNKVSTLVNLTPSMLSSNEIRGNSNQLVDEITSRNTRQQQNNPNHFFQLFGCYSTENFNDPLEYSLFYELLKFVHNDCLNMGVEYLFIGLSKTDPIDRYFPLLPGIKSLPFVMHFCLGNEEDHIQEIMVSYYFMLILIII
ncbi:hypothetical protein DFA_09436 [Cavenderia fasciculata]|uniref:Uncharacterized protein n=1 Tax=Cavenderia fasciculata TaxID=261658 RepID=F4Q7M0_CACFS|nr:uncharacterized protein DFA_09436 [Cavenderia fasciculata]EGG16402.1 hypothetical protein DFA_09436 [Cavenderia fasciculata]|eukprot:XP_004354786.1 hypothetical protein DFA_09436 [Cavenderia fasciculata]